MTVMCYLSQKQKQLSFSILPSVVKLPTRSRFKKKKPIRKKKSLLSLDLSVHGKYISQEIHQVHQNLFLLLFFFFFSVQQLEDGRIFV